MDKKKSKKDNIQKKKINKRYLKRMRSLLKRKQSYSPFFNLIKKTLFVEKLIAYFAHIRISPNNTIATFTDRKGDVLYNLSAGNLNLKSSKRSYKFVYKIVLGKFFAFLTQKHLLRNIYFRISAPKFLRKKIIRTFFLPKIQKTNCAVEMLRILPFNGCRPPKKRRKKRQGLRVFKS
jgi:ribosomal protein S11